MIYYLVITLVLQALDGLTDALTGLKNRRAFFEQAELLVKYGFSQVSAMLKSAGSHASRLLM